MSDGIVLAKLKYDSSVNAGIILNYQDTENFGVARLHTAGGKVRVKHVEVVDGQKQVARATGGTFSLTHGDDCTIKCRISGSTGSRVINVYVDGTGRLFTNTIDSIFEGGCVGLFRSANDCTDTLRWDNFKCGIDGNADGDVDDDGTDLVYADHGFDGSWTTMTLIHADNQLDWVDLMPAGGVRLSGGYDGECRTSPKVDPAVRRSGGCRKCPVS